MSARAKLIVSCRRKCELTAESDLLERAYRAGIYRRSFNLSQMSFIKVARCSAEETVHLGHFRVRSAFGSTAKKYRGRYYKLRLKLD